MGRQINYYMNYESFLQVAQAAMDAGCFILKAGHTDTVQEPSSDISVVTPEWSNYYFYLPELSELNYKTDIYGKYYLDHSYNAMGLAVIEAGFSKHPDDRARIYVMSGFYDENDTWIARSEKITKVYNKLARKVRKVAQRIL